MSDVMSVPLQAGGTVDRSTSLYIERAEDADLLALLSEARYANVLTSRQMGKSSLMLSTARKLQTRGIDCVIIDIAGQLGRDEDQSSAYEGLLESIRDQLDIDMNIAEWLAAAPRGTPNQHFLRFFREIGKHLTRPVVVFLDEIDASLSIPYADDLFTAIRTIHNERSVHEGYRRFTFCLLGVASPNDLVKNQRTTAYNIGVTLELRDFDPERDDLSRLLPLLHPDLEIGRQMLQSILHWTGGHPYLTIRFAADLANDGATDVDAYVRKTYLTLRTLSSDTHFAQIIRFMALRLSDALATFALYERILDGAHEPDLPALPQTQLKLSGLVKRNNAGHLIVRNPLYAQLFDRQWVGSSRPRRSLRYLFVYAAALSIFIAAATLMGSAYVRAERIARHHLSILATTANPLEARRSRDLLEGAEADALTLLFIRRHRAEAQKAFAAFVSRHAGKLELRAEDDRRRGAVETALLFGARAAAWREQPIGKETLALYADAGFDRLSLTLRGPAVFSGEIAVSPDGRSIAIGNSVWSARDGRLLYELPDRSVNTVAFDGQGVLYSGNDDGEIKRWIGGKPQPFDVEIPANRSLLTAIAVSADGSVIGTVSSEETDALLHSVPDGRLTQLPHDAPVTSIRFSDARTAVTASGTRVRLWTWNGRLERTLQHDAAVRAVAISRDGATIATAAGSVLTLWNARGEKIDSRDERTSRIDDVAFSGDGSEVATVSIEGLRRYQAGDPLVPIETIPADKPIALAYAPDRSWIVTRSVTSARIWTTRRVVHPTQPAPRVLADWEKRLGLVVVADDQNVIVNPSSP